MSTATTSSSDPIAAELAAGSPAEGSAGVSAVSIRERLQGPEADSIRRKITHPLLSRLWMAVKLPLGLFSGMRIRHLDAERCEVAIRYGWRNTNPFRSMYFAAQSMAAELSTGAPALVAARSAPESVAMLITGLDASFSKKADSLIVFTCDSGDQLAAAVEETLATGEGASADVVSIGRNPQGEEVARFVFRWSFRVRRKR
ncbi:MAG: DUF4442 domain-containing protein [Acidobacteriota bacterium]